MNRGKDGRGRDALASPCVNVCRIEPASGLCEGCRRTLDEIAAWPSLDDDAKRALLRELRERRRALADGVRP